MRVFLGIALHGRIDLRRDAGRDASEILRQQAEFVTEPFRQYTRVPVGVHELSVEGVGRRRDELLDLDE